MSSRGILSNKLYIDVRIPFQDAWEDLDSEEQKKIVSSNIDMIDDDELIAELEYRGYNVTEKE